MCRQPSVLELEQWSSPVAQLTTRSRFFVFSCRRKGRARAAEVVVATAKPVEERVAGRANWERVLMLRVCECVLVATCASNLNCV